MPKSSHFADHEFFEALESRLALYISPLLDNLPSLSEMSSPQNTVVRMSTSAGYIDIELYDRAGPDGASTAPITTANFLNYISSGRYESTFFHRLVPTFALQGGGFRYIPPATSVEVQTDPPIVNEFDPGRSNVERTIAMAKLGGNPDSATSQFFFNLGDNSETLDPQNGGFTVFGRVIQGWDIVQIIAGYQVRDLDQFFTGSNPPGPGRYDEVPLSGPSNTDLVLIHDMEVIKPGGQTEFFTTALYYPEGYRAVQITSTVELYAQDVSTPVAYEIIARFEVGSRDRVIASGTLDPGVRARIPISVGGDPSVDKVRAYTPFAYEIRATAPIAATLEHRDFGATAIESFLDPAPLTEDQLKNWTFASGLVGQGLPAYLVWESIADEAATLTINFHTDSGQTHTITKTLEPFRRGGLNLVNLGGLPPGLFSVHIASTQPIVAALSQYRVFPGRASSEMGMHDDKDGTGGSGASQGILPGAIIPADGQSLLSMVYTGSASSVQVQLSFVLSDGTVLDGGSQTLSSSLRRRDFDLRSLHGALPTGEFFTVRYTVAGGERVGASFTSITAGDTMRMALQNASTGELFFAGGFMDPASPGREVISLYNPMAGGNVQVTYRLRFHFVDASGNDVILFPINGQGTLGRRLDIDITTLSDVVAQVNAGESFRHYSITVETDITDDNGPVTGAIFGQLTRIGMNGQTGAYGPNFNPGQSPFTPG